MSRYLPVPSDDIEDPPPSPWRIKAREYTRRSAVVRRVIAIAASLAFAVPLFLLLGYVREDRPRPVSENIVHPHNHSTSLDPDIVTFSSLSASASLTASLSAPPPASTSLPSLNHTSHDPVVFSLIMWSTNSAREGAILIKSIIMYTSAPVEFHIICDPDARVYLEKRLNLVHHPRHNVLVRYYHVPWDAMIARLKREGAVVSDHSAGTPGLMKLFIHEILPLSVKKSIFIDTDAFFISDPTLLWEHFKSIPSNVAVSMPSHPEMMAPEWHNANRICSCIMLLNLERLREIRLMDSSVYRSDPQGPPAFSPPAFRAMFGPPGPQGHYEGVKLGDQGYWWAIINHDPEIFQHLSYDWEVSSCLLDMYLTGLGHDDATESDELAVQIHTYATPHQGQVILPKLAHFNCLDESPLYYEWHGWQDPNNGLNQRWGAAVRYHMGWKWLWLNQGSNGTVITTEIVENAGFLDELLSNTLPATSS